MAGTRRFLPRLPWLARLPGGAPGTRTRLLVAALACGWLWAGPLLAQAPELRGLRVLPQLEGGRSFAGWQSEGEVAAALDVPLELGDEVHGATLQLQPAASAGPWRVRVQYETSLGLGAEGPHLDLTDWKHCVSAWVPAESSGPLSFVLPAPSPEQQACFPAYTAGELEQAVRDHAARMGDASQADGWLQGLRAPSTGMSTTPVTPFVAISAVRVRVEVKRDGRWVEATTVTFVPPMGC
ncbi:hypothetical protein [Pseudoxanthomonas sp. 10H]|uniref:hypothetical protein n=1 Tax=Pseudoxanthomonas sp. 10H TaxID=3242729 RepID=UPI0035577FF8